MEALQAIESWPSDAMESVTKCPACQSARREVELGGLVDDTFFCASGSWTMMRCQDCCATYLDPRPREAVIHLAYKSYYTHSREAPPRGLLARARRALDNTYRNRVFGTDYRPSLPLGRLLARATKRAHRLTIERSDRGLAALAQRGRVLDVGCGHGAFLSFARDLGWQAFGVELDDSAAQTAAAHGIQVLAGSLAGLNRKYEGFFDAITLSHVIEHLHQPCTDLQRCLRLLRPGGYLWVETPNIESFGFKLFGRYWRGVEAPRHLVLFNEGSLAALLRRAGFQAVRQLPVSNHAPLLFQRSTMIRAGFRPEDDPSKLSWPARLQLRAAVQEATARAADNPASAEYLCMRAYKPA